ncbi:class III lanthipeptide [Saccharicrinis aurantiacus]
MVQVLELQALDAQDADAPKLSSLISLACC